MSIIDTRTPNPKSFIKGQTGDWEVIIGMEVHAQVTSESKLFSGSSTEFGRPANSNVSFVDAAMPGMLPVINEECVRQAVRTGLGLKAEINKRSIFDRKNYFYPDLPQGYQISQFKDPIVGEGEVLVERDDGTTFTVRIERLHGSNPGKPGDMMQELVTASGERWVSASRFAAYAERLGSGNLAMVVQLLTGWRALIAQMPPKVFADLDARTAVITAVQEAMHAAVAKEESGA